MERIRVYRRLDFKIAFFIFIVGLLPLFIGIFFLFKNAERFVKEDVFNNLKFIARNSSDEIFRFLSSCTADIKILADSENLRNPAVSADKKLLEMKKIQDYYKRFEDITLINTMGRVVTSTTYNYRGEWRTKKWFREAINGRVYISDAHIILDPYKVVVAIAVPLIDYYGKIQGALVGQLNMGSLWEILNKITVGKTGFVSVVNNQNYIIAHPDKENIFQYAPFDMSKQFGVIDRMGSKSEIFVYSVDECVFNMDCEFPKWQIVVAQERWETMLRIVDLKFSISYVLVGGFSMIIITSVIISRGITRPIHILIRGMARVSGGDLNYKTDINSKDEIGLLGLSFNDMLIRLDKARQEIEKKTADLQHAFDEINELNINLERKVEERTKELREKQFQLIQSGKLAAIGQLGAGVAHELNNPLAGIMGYVQLMLERISKGDLKTEDIYSFRRYLQHIEKGSRRCKEIVQNLLRFAGQSHENFESLNVNNVVADTLSLIERQLLMNNIKVIKNLAGNIKMVKGNAIQLQQVFTNIIVNAQHAMPDGGHLFISSGNKDDTVEIEFRDTGCGIAGEHIGRIFEPFFTTKMDWKGTGLGLSICYDIIRNHNGNIAVDSRVGGGATFTVILPVESGYNG